MPFLSLFHEVKYALWIPVMDKNTDNIILLYGAGLQRWSWRERADEEQSTSFNYLVLEKSIEIYRALSESFFPMSAVEGIKSVLSVCVSVKAFVGPGYRGWLIIQVPKAVSWTNECLQLVWPFDKQTQVGTGGLKMINLHRPGKVIPGPNTGYQFQLKLAMVITTHPPYAS